MNREQHCQRVQGVRRERAANTGRRSEQRAALPANARDEDRAADHITKHFYSAQIFWVFHKKSVLLFALL